MARENAWIPNSPDPTNPTAVQLQVKMHGFQPAQTLQTLQSVSQFVQLHVKGMDSKQHGPYQPYSCSIARGNAWIPNSPDLTNPTVSCSIARENAWILDSADLTNPTIQLFTCT